MSPLTEVRSLTFRSRQVWSRRILLPTCKHRLHTLQDRCGRAQLPWMFRRPMGIWWTGRWTLRANCDEKPGRSNHRFLLGGYGGVPDYLRCCQGARRLLFIGAGQKVHAYPNVFYIHLYPTHNVIVLHIVVLDAAESLI